MGMKEIFQKLMNRTTQPRYPKISPNEVELMAFKERERKDNIKKELTKYREKESHELIFGRALGTHKDTILSQRPMPSHNVFNKKSKYPSLLDFGGSIF